MRAWLIAALSFSLPALLAAQPADRTQPPRLGPAPPLTLPRVEERTLVNGLEVWLVDSREVPLVQLNLVIHAGSGDDPDGQFGLASLTAAMLDEGAGERSALEIADALEFLGADLSTASSFVSSGRSSGVASVCRGSMSRMRRSVRLRTTGSANRIVPSGLAHETMRPSIPSRSDRR